MFAYKEASRGVVAVNDLLQCLFSSFCSTCAGCPVIPFRPQVL